jgi:UTP--glucose-1-phosphate uridylyltransferase
LNCLLIPEVSTALSVFSADYVASSLCANPTGIFMSLHTTVHQTPISQAQAKMRHAGLPQPVIENFTRLHAQVAAGSTGVIEERQIAPVGELTKLEQLAEYRRAGLEALNSLVVIRLNGGLGTTMGLSSAKSLLPVREGRTFNDIMIDQLRALKKSTGAHIPLVHMTSFSTDDDVRRIMDAATDMRIEGLPAVFQQHKHPKVFADSLAPTDDSEEELNWNPPGHGDIYAALIATGLAEKLLAQGRRFVFVANSDNLGATVDPSILGYIIAKSCPFLMETCIRTAADSKGGHVARYKENGRLLLRESAQAPKTSSGQISPEFGDIAKYDQFNTNNIWLDLQAVVEVAQSNNGCIPLPLISNSKTLNPRDPRSPKVIQIESAMGAAIELFEGAIALQVPRERFVPVKSNNDLLRIRSDLYVLTQEAHLVQNPGRTLPGLPTIALDPKYFGMITDFQDRMRFIPSLLHATHFEVNGDVILSKPLAVHGKVTITADPQRQCDLAAQTSVLCDITVIL